jgi:hypothetical protein
MNWGTRITILYCSFVALMLGMVYMSVHQKVDLVSADYYEKELRFQGKIDGLKNTADLPAGFAFEVVANKIILHYPQALPWKRISGEICFYRPSDSQRDEKFKALPDTNNIQTFQLKNPKRGLYKLLCDLEADGKKYYYEESIQLN